MSIFLCSAAGRPDARQCNSLSRRFHGGGLAWGFRPGVTLIELLIVSVVMAFVGTGAIMLFRNSVQHERYQQENAIQLQNLRAAMYAVSRDVRMAGSGLSLIGANNIYIFVPTAIIDPDTQDDTTPWFRYAGEADLGVVRIMGTNSGIDPDKCDTLTIFRTEVEGVTPIGQLQSAYAPGVDPNFTLTRAVTEGEVVEDEDILAINSGDRTIIVQASFPNIGGLNATVNLGPRFRPGAPMPGNYEFPAGSKVYNLRNVVFVTYYVDTVNKRLMANYHDAGVNDLDAENAAQPHLVTVADNIEDFQVEYFLRPLGSGTVNDTATADIGLGNLRNNSVAVVRIGMVSRARVGTKMAGDTDVIEIMGHEAASNEGFSRRVLFETIQVRNPA